MSPASSGNMDWNRFAEIQESGKGRSLLDSAHPLAVWLKTQEKKPAMHSA